MQLKNISEKFLPDLLKNEFGKEIFIQIDNQSHLSVRGSAGSSASVFAAELFLTHKKTLLFLVDDKEEAL